MLRIAIAFLLGHCAMFVGPRLLQEWELLAVAAVLLTLSVLLRSRALVALLFGGVLAWHAGATGLENDLHASLEGKDVLVTGEVVSLPEPLGRGVQFDFELLARTVGLPRVARLSWYDTDVVPQPGQRWELLVRMKRRHGFANPGCFDYEAFLFRAGIGATGYVRDSADNRLLPSRASARLLQARAHIATVIAQATHAHPLTGVLQGLAVGVQSAMTAEQWRVFARTGTTHLMAISGFHIGMVAASMAWLGGMLCVRVWPQRSGVAAIHGQAIGGFASALGYAALAGMSIPTQRTLIMLCLYFSTRLLRRPLSVTHAIALALVLVLWVDPFAPLAPGAWLSFLAVGAILLATLGRRGAQPMIREFGRAQWAVTVGLLPVVMIAFGGVSLVGPVANALAIPVFTFLLVPLVLVGTAIATVWLPAGELVLALPLWLLQGVWYVLARLAESPLATWHAPVIEPWALMLCGLGAAGLLIPSIWPIRMAALALCLPALCSAPRAPGHGELQLTLLDVGQGLSAVVRTQHHTLVYDTGPVFRSGRDTSELVVLPFLWANGIRRTDMLMISHSDADHAGGMPTFLRDMPTQQVVHGPSLATRAGSRVCYRGQRWTWDGVHFEVLHPALEADWSDNDSSCVLRITTGTQAVLLTGDVESRAEAALLPELQQSDVLTVPHHGSRTSSTEAFVASAKPRYALVSAGYRNRWGFPKDEVVQRWERAGAHVLTTAHVGAVTVQLTPRSIGELREHRAEHRRFWSWRP